jgi:sugar phosphate isomerase/epimerase
MNPTPTHQAPVSVQLYSLRDEAATDFPSVLRRLGEVGFAGVELAGFHGHQPGEVRQIIEDAGMQISSAHIPSVADGAKQSLDELASIGCTTAALAWLPPDQFDSIDSIRRNASLINIAASEATNRGMRLGYHNHWWEFEKTIDGVTGWDLLLAELDPWVFVELDIYWATVAGVSPVDVITQPNSRVRLLHVKDGPADNPENPMVAVGTGTIPVQTVLRSSVDIDWHIVELDRCATDMFDAVAASYRYLTTNNLSTGRR